MSIKVETGQTLLEFNEKKNLVLIKKGNAYWNWSEDFRARLVCREGEFLFRDACRISHEAYRNGTGQGIRSYYQGWIKEGRTFSYAFETLMWIEGSTEDVYFEWIPLEEKDLHVEKVFWPGPMEFDKPKDSWYTLLTRQQGLLIPNTWDTALSSISFDGMFETAGGYMPWFGQVKEKDGYIAICETPWDAGYYAVHPAKGPYTHVGAYFLPSLGKMDYRRVLRYTFEADCDYNRLCKIYRQYVKETGKLRTLKEKAAAVPSVDDLVGCAFVHTGIKTVVQPDSEFYDSQAPEKNNRLVSFRERAELIRELKKMGVEKLYLHLDGWAQPGYDNQHPDYLPACKEAGGWEGMKDLADTLHEAGYLFGIHDQYRDYYRAAPSFDENYACRMPDGTIPGHRRWAGGPQTYLCASQAPFYVKRNFTEISRQGISLDCAYLDVFTCNEGDECANPEHRMTRRECYDYREQCFRYLLAQGILPSSEEVSDWAAASLVFCHYAPYDFMLKKPGTPKEGIPVPLFNLVYHDCIIQPWMMDKVNTGEDYMLYALLNGGAPYLIREGAYPNTDGSFHTETEEKPEELIERCRIVSDLQKQTAYSEMLYHRILTADYKVQETGFADGTRVQVDFNTQTWQIFNGKTE